MFLWRWNRMDEKLWWENRKENFFWSIFGWVERKENKWWGPSVFFPDPPKCFLSKMERKLNGDKFFLDWQKYPCAYSSIYLFFFFSMQYCCPFFVFVFVLFVFFFFLTRCDFFLGHDFYFFNKFGWLLFFCGYLSLFLF